MKSLIDIIGHYWHSMCYKTIQPKDSNKRYCITALGNNDAQHLCMLNCIKKNGFKFGISCVQINIVGQSPLIINMWVNSHDNIDVMGFQYKSDGSFSYMFEGYAIEVPKTESEEHEFIETCETILRLNPEVSKNLMCYDLHPIGYEIILMIQEFINKINEIVPIIRLMDEHDKTNKSDFPTKPIKFGEVEPTKDDNMDKEMVNP